MTNRHQTRSKLLARSSVAALGLSLAVGAPAPVLAQEGEAAGEDRVTVTGTRIQRRDFQANSPIVTVESDTFENQSSVGVEATLNQLPQFTPAGTAFQNSSAGAAFAGADAAPGAATLNLRGLGPNRSLVLVNGRRAQPVNGQLFVDVNSIPSAAIENVEVISGGAAAVYGADAIAGVVNFILKDDFEGMEFDVQYGMAEAGDGENAQASALVGGNFANGRGNAMFGAVWSQRSTAYQKNRDFYTEAWLDPNTTGSNGVPIRTATVAGNTYGFNPDGSLYDADDAGPDSLYPWTGPTHNLENGAGFKLNPPTVGSGNQSLSFNNPTNEVTIPLTRYSMFGSAHYDITPSVEFFIEGNFTETQTSALSQPAPAGNIWAFTVPYNQANDDPDSPTFGSDQSNFYPVSRGLADLLNAQGEDGASSWSLGGSLAFLGRLNTDTTSTIHQITSGLRGEVGIKDWTWEAYGSHGKTNVMVQQLQGPVSYENMQQILSGNSSSGNSGTNGPRSLTIDGPWSQGWSSGAVFNPSFCDSGIPIFNADGSVPFDPNQVDALQISDNCRDYVTLELNNITKLEQNIFEATVQGGLIDYWAGEARFAAGFTYRDADFNFQPDTGNSGEQAGTNVVNQIALPNQTQGFISVAELYGELLIPLVANVPLIQNLELELGGRYSDYNTAGGVGTYKILGDWRVTDWLRFRGGYQLANRAPNIYELFAPIAGAIGASRDPCVNIDGFTPEFGNTPDNPNLLNLQEACEALIVRDGGFDYVTLAEDPTATEQDPDLYPNLDRTRMSNHRWILGYNGFFPFSIALEQGNLDLDSEEAETVTVGAVIRSPWQHDLLDRFTLSVDYYSIDITGTITTPSGVTIYEQCLSPQYNDLMSAPAGSVTGAEIIANNPYCDLVNRYPFDENGVRGASGSGTDRTFDAQFLNQGGTKTSGIDFTVNWGADWEDLGMDFIPGAINFNGLASFVFEYAEAPFAGAEYVDYVGTSERLAYDYRLNGSLNWIFDNASLGLRARYWPSIDPATSAPATTMGADSHTEFDLFGRYTLGDKYEFRAGIDNVFDTDPPIFGATPSNAARGSTLGAYDTLGRRYYVGLTVRM